METSYFQETNGSSADSFSASKGVSSPVGGTVGRSNAFSTRITSVLSTSYADLDLRNALDTLDSRDFANTQDNRRNLRLDLQQEVIRCNGDIIKDFGQVAEVG